MVLPPAEISSTWKVQSPPLPVAFTTSVPLPFGPGQSGGGDEGGESFDPRSREKVEIPKPEQYKVPAEFREDILKAAKQNTAEAYKEAVRRYYEEIVK